MTKYYVFDDWGVPKEAAPSQSSESDAAQVLRDMPPLDNAKLKAKLAATMEVAEAAERAAAEMTWSRAYIPEANEVHYDAALAHVLDSLEALAALHADKEGE